MVFVLLFSNFLLVNVLKVVINNCSEVFVYYCLDARRCLLLLVYGCYSNV